MTNEETEQENSFMFLSIIFVGCIGRTKETNLYNRKGTRRKNVW